MLPAKAAVFIDGRYTVQVRDQVDGSLYDYVGVPQSSVAEWLGANVSAGQKIGYDPWLHGIDWARGLAAALTAKGASLIAVDTNPIDAVWDDQPAPSAAPIAVYDTEQAGQSGGRQARRDRRLAEGAGARHHGDDRARFDRLDLQHPR